MSKALALSFALLLVPSLSQALDATPVPAKQAATKAKKAPKKTGAQAKEAAKPLGTKQATEAHEHAEEAWVCNTFYGDHVCTYKSAKGGKCAWCGVPMVKAGSKEDLERQAKATKK